MPSIIKQFTKTLLPSANVFVGNDVEIKGESDADAGIQLTNQSIVLAGIGGAVDVPKVISNLNGTQMAVNNTKIGVDKATEEMYIQGVPDAVDDATSGVAIGSLYFNTTINAYTKRLV